MPPVREMEAELAENAGRIMDLQKRQIELACMLKERGGDPVAIVAAAQAKHAGAAGSNGVGAAASWGAPEAAASGAASGNGTASGLAAADEKLLDEWVAVKLARDFTRADEIRADLRSRGIEPNELRPPGGPTKPGDWNCPSCGFSNFQSRQQCRKCEEWKPEQPPQKFDAATEKLLDEWWAAKRARNYDVSDRIRNQLNAKGIRPDDHRPQGGAGGSWGGGGGGGWGGGGGGSWGGGGGGGGSWGGSGDRGRSPARSTGPPSRSGSRGPAPRRGPEADTW